MSALSDAQLAWQHCFMRTQHADKTWRCGHICAKIAGWASLDTTCNMFAPGSVCLAASMTAQSLPHCLWHTVASVSALTASCSWVA
jgi:hypothetical protein